MQHLILFTALAVLFVFMVPSALRFVRGAGLALALIVLATVPAMAQEVDGATGLMAAVLPYIMDILAIVLMAALTWASAWAKRKFNIDIEAKHRDGLHSALMTGARLAASRQLTGQAAIALIVDYVRKSVPDALASLKPSSAVLQDLAQSKLQEALAEQIGGLIRR